MYFASNRSDTLSLVIRATDRNYLVEYFREVIMCIKTTFKRMALIVATALPLSGVLAVTANAAPVNLILSATGITSAGTSATQIAGPGNSVSVSNTVLGGSGHSIYFTVSGGSTSSGAKSGTIQVNGSINIPTPKVATITLYGYAIVSGAASNNPTDTIIITVISSLPGTEYASSTILVAPSTSLPTTATDSSFNIIAPSGTANVANFTVTELDSGGNTLLPTHAQAITVVGTGVLIASPNLSYSPSSNTSFLTGIPVAPTTDFVISGVSGFGGIATIKILINGKNKRTISIKFTGIAHKIVLTVINSVIGVGDASALRPTAGDPIGIRANTNALEVQEFDGNGNLLAINPSNISIMSSAQQIATSGSLDNVGAYTLGDLAGGTPTSSVVLGVSVNGHNVGATTLTAKDNAHNIASGGVTVRVSNGVTSYVVIAANLATYVPGGLGTLHTTLSNASGTMPAGTYVVFTGQATASIAFATGSAQLPGAPMTVSGPPVQKIGQITVNNVGVYTDSFNAPVNSGNEIISAEAVSKSITIHPATFVVGTGEAVATSESLNEAGNSITAASDIFASVGASADGADRAAALSAAQVLSVLGVIKAFTSSVRVTRIKSAMLAYSMKLILKKVGKK